MNLAFQHCSHLHQQWLTKSNMISVMKLAFHVVNTHCLCDPIKDITECNCICPSAVVLLNMQWPNLNTILFHRSHSIWLEHKIIDITTHLMSAHTLFTLMHIFATKCCLCWILYHQLDDLLIPRCAVYWCSTNVTWKTRQIYCCIHFLL